MTHEQVKLVCESLNIAVDKANKQSETRKKF